MIVIVNKFFFFNIYNIKFQAEDRLKIVEDQRRLHEDRMKMEEEQSRRNKEEQEKILGRKNSRAKVSFGFKL